MADLAGSKHDPLGIRTGIAGADQGEIRRALHAVCGKELSLLRGWCVRERFFPTTLTVVPQRPFRAERLHVNRPQDWVIHDIRIGQFSHVGSEISAEAFANERIDLGVQMTGIPIHVLVEYVGGNPAGAMFHGALIGRDPDDARARVPLALVSDRPIHSRQDHPVNGRHVWLRLEDEIFRFEERGGRLQAVYRVTAMPPDTSPTGTWVEIDPPRMITLRVAPVPPVAKLRAGEYPAFVLYGTDDAKHGEDAVVFEIGDSGQAPFEAKLELAGYTPSWWSSSESLGTEIPVSVRADP